MGHAASRFSKLKCSVSSYRFLGLVKRFVCEDLLYLQSWILNKHLKVIHKVLFYLRKDSRKSHYI
jgi:hypothetical protein